MVIRERLRKVREYLADERGDALLVTNAANVRYLSGFSGSWGVLYISEEYAELITDGRYIKQAEEETKDWPGEIHIVAQGETLSKRILGLAPKKLGVEKSITLEVYTKLVDTLNDTKVFPVEGWIENMRMVKADEEIVKIREAIRAAEKAFEMAFSIVSPGCSEFEIAAELEYQMRKLFGAIPAFDTIVAVGERAAMPHAVPSSRTWQNGELLLVDMGAVMHGYHSDFTRVILSGELNSEVYRVIDAVEEALISAVDAVKPGVRASQLDGVARGVLEDRGLARYFTHSLGHGVGLEIHEGPTLSPSADLELKEGMVFTIEPGVYMPDKVGVRLEEMVLLTPQGAEVLTSLPRRIEV